MFFQEVLHSLFLENEETNKSKIWKENGLVLGLCPVACGVMPWCQWPQGHPAVGTGGGHGAGTSLPLPLGLGNEPLVRGSQRQW